MRVLVAYGSKNGGTAGLAGMIGTGLLAHGLDVEILPAAEVHDVARFDAVIVAGALYAGRWHRDARRFVRELAGELAQLPVWLVSSGPLDDSAATTDIPPVPQVRRLAEQIGARGHVTFGGRLATDVTGFPAHAMAKTRAGDWRDPAEIQAWTQVVAAELLGQMVS
ncbi:MAG TPA: flavodoxin domain-containing protein [Pseudonocardiaceae bacterium]|nr:flavodoxin domain-containing protein [Pseudonocardiaceae bacterium]